MRSYQGNNMKKVILTAVLFFSVSAMADVVHYDIRDTKKPTISKPNCPSTGLYIKK